MVRDRVSVVDAEQLVCLEVERADEAGMRVEQQQPDHHREPDQGRVEAPLLEPGVPAHAQRDQDAGQGDRDERDHEDSVLRAEPGITPARPGPPERRPQRLEELD